MFVVMVWYVCKDIETCWWRLPRVISIEVMM